MRSGVLFAKRLVFGFELGDPGGDGSSPSLVAREVAKQWASPLVLCLAFPERHDPSTALIASCDADIGPGNLEARFENERLGVFSAAVNQANRRRTMSWHSQDAASKPGRSRMCIVPLSCRTRPARCNAPMASVTPGRRTPSMVDMNS